MVSHGFHKKKSKRIPARLRYKVEKKVKDHHRKIKKDAKKNRDPTIKRKKPVVIIPGNVPFKDKIIQEAKEIKEREVERKKLLKSILKGDTNIKAIINEKQLIKLNSKKNQIKVKKSKLINKTLTPTTSTSEAMQCD